MNMMMVRRTLFYRRSKGRPTRTINATKMPMAVPMLTANANFNAMLVPGRLPRRFPCFLNKFAANVMLLLEQTLSSRPRLVLLVSLAGIIFIKDCQRLVPQT